MGKLFGTDGIRGVVNVNLDGALAFRTGQATAISLAAEKGSVPTIMIGMDTRISSDMLENALAAGLCACGANVIKLGVIPTPAVAYLTVLHKADAGIVISASHNPFEHNGIKIFSGEGFKLSDALEEGIEKLILQGEELPLVTHAQLGRMTDGSAFVEEYLDHLQSTAGNLSGLRLCIDCANGAASATARRLFSRFSMEVTYLCDQPDGVNINDGCGSTHLQHLSETVRHGDFDLGLAFDGDADRCLAVDENGEGIDGDQIMAVCALELLKGGKLKNDGFVATVMSNLGLHKFAREQGLTLRCSAVGDRNVLELMQESGMRLGGEQSGHIIFLDHMTTGDGQLAALQFLTILAGSGKKASELAGLVTHYPQTLVNVKGPHDNAAKKALCDDPRLDPVLTEAKKLLAGEGRILLRPSGTEALIRVMVEAGTQQAAETAAKLVAEAVENLQK